MCSWGTSLTFLTFVVHSSTILVIAVLLTQDCCISDHILPCKRTDILHNTQVLTQKIDSKVKGNIIMMEQNYVVESFNLDLRD